MPQGEHRQQPSNAELIAARLARGLSSAPEGAVAQIVAAVRAADAAGSEFPAERIIREAFAFRSPLTDSKRAADSPHVGAGEYQFLLVLAGMVASSVAMVGEGATSDDAIQALRKVNLLEDHQSQSVEAIVHAAVANRTRIRQWYEAGQLHTAGGPTLWDVLVSTDVKVQVEGEDVIATLPVAVVGLETNESDDLFTFHVSGDQLDALIGRLMSVRQKLRVLGMAKGVPGAGEGA